MKSSKDNPALEFINPGKGTRIPLSRILPGLQKSAEAAISREEIPEEYEDFVGSYFKELSREAGNP